MATTTAAARDIVVGGIAVLATLVASPVLRRRYNRHGATDTEVAAAMPGDDLVKEPKLGFTRAVTVNAPPAEVWPWLAQIGQGRGGLYSYDALENLVGCNIQSADSIVPEHQNLAPGDIIRSGPDRFPCWVVVRVEAPRHLVLLGAGTAADVSVPEIVAEVPAKGYAASTWQWELRPHGGGARTRLVVRQRLTYSPNQRLLWRIVEPINFVMERKMLEGIRTRAERAPTPNRDTSLVSRPRRWPLPRRGNGEPRRRGDSRSCVRRR